MDGRVESKNEFSGYYLLIPVLMAVFLYMTGITSTDLWTPDEPRYAEVAREMIERGNYIQPHINGKPYTEKPPLFFWMVAVGAKLFGDVNPFTVRLPSILSALGTLSLMLVFISEFFDRKKAFLTAIILCLMPQFFTLARSGHIDMLLTFLITTSLVSFYRWYARNKYGYLTVFYLCLALATLAKGPIGLLLPLMVALCFLMFRKEWGKIRKMHIYAGLPIAIMLVLVWYIPATQQSAGYDFGPMAKRQIVGRIFHPSSHAVSVFYWPFYHIQSLVQGTTPWIFLIPSAVIAAYRYRRNAPLFFLLCWALAVFAFFTIIASKRSLYILPMYPPIAAMIALWVLDSAQTSRLRLVRVMSISMGVLLLVVVAITPIILTRKFQDATFHYSWEIIIPVAIASIVAMLPAVFFRKHEYIIGTLVVSIMIFYTTLSITICPLIDRYKSARGICSVYTNLRDPDSEVAMFGNVREEYIFYTHSMITLVENREDIKKFFESSKKMFCFIKVQDYQRILSQPDFPVYVLVRTRVSSRKMMLLCNQDIARKKTLSGYNLPLLHTRHLSMLNSSTK